MLNRRTDFSLELGPSRSDPALVLTNRVSSSHSQMNPPLVYPIPERCPRFNWGFCFSIFHLRMRRLTTGKCKWKSAFWSVGPANVRISTKRHLEVFFRFEAENNQFRPCKPSRMEICRFHPSSLLPAYVKTSQIRNGKLFMSLEEMEYEGRHILPYSIAFSLCLVWKMCPHDVQDVECYANVSSCCLFHPNELVNKRNNEQTTKAALELSRGGEASVGCREEREGG